MYIHGVQAMADQASKRGARGGSSNGSGKDSGGRIGGDAASPMAIMRNVVGQVRNKRSCFACSAITALVNTRSSSIACFTGLCPEVVVAR